MLARGRSRSKYFTLWPLLVLSSALPPPRSWFPAFVVAPSALLGRSALRLLRCFRWALALVAAAHLIALRGGDGFFVRSQFLGLLAVLGL